MVIRKNYLDKLISFKDSSFIKIITGLRRSGKSTLMLMFKDYLLKNDILEENIIYMNFESAIFDEIDDYKKLYSFIKSKIKDKKVYILLDEVQMVSKWEKCVNSLLVDFNCDIYLTGSNAYLLSSELATLLAGRYIQIKMYPLSFKEYLDFKEFKSNVSMEDKFYEYLKWGGMPSIPTISDNESLVRTYLTDVTDAVIKKDIIARNNIKDVALLENITKFVASSIGSSISPFSIANYLSNNATNPSNVTIDNYLTMLENAFIIYKAERYDIKGKQLLKTLGKYYIVDSGIRNSLIGFSNIDEGHLLQNIVYLELLRRGYDVNIGKNDENEIDFIATKIDKKIYYQVCRNIESEDTLNRELKSLSNINDNYEKIVITADRKLSSDVNGIKFVNIIDFLLEK